MCKCTCARHGAVEGDRSQMQEHISIVRSEEEKIRYLMKEK